MIISGSAAHPLIFDGRCFHICYNSHLHSRTRFADNSQTHDRSQNNSPSPVSRIKKPLKMKRTYIYRILFPISPFRRTRRVRSVGDTCHADSSGHRRNRRPRLYNWPPLA